MVPGLADARAVPAVGRADGYARRARDPGPVAGPDRAGRRPVRPASTPTVPLKSEPWTGSTPSSDLLRLRRHGRRCCPSCSAVGLVNTLIISDRGDRHRRRPRHAHRRHGHLPLTWLRVPARIYTDLFRGLPAILTILLIGQGFARFSQQVFGPSPYPLGIIALSLIASAYIGEIFRAGIQSVDRGQGEACRALGMSYAKSMALVVVPQGVRRVLPALVNQFIAIVKDSSPGLLPGPAGHRARTVPRGPGRRSPVRQPLAAGPGRDLLPGDHGAPDPSGQLLRQPLPHRPAQAPPPQSGLKEVEELDAASTADLREQHMSLTTPPAPAPTDTSSRAPAWN